jgi:hypothetical protein
VSVAIRRAGMFGPESVTPATEEEHRSCIHSVTQCQEGAGQ